MRIVLTGGGTVGHITPLLEFMKELGKYGDHTFYYLGNQNYVEKKIASEQGIPFYHIGSKSTEVLHTFMNKMEFLKENCFGTMDAAKVLKVIKPDFIISAGGFVTAPVLMAANVLRIPYFIHEQNKVLGKVNKLFLMTAKEVYYTFEETLGGQNKRKGKTFGNPVQNFGLSSKGESYFLRKEI